MSTEITDLAKAVYAAGPSSSPFMPEKADIIRLFELIQSLLDQMRTLAATAQQWKAPVRVASTASVTLSSAVENGDTLDGVVLATGDRILLKNQTTASQNGIYIVAASGAPSRASDADEASEFIGAAVFVTSGTANGGKQFICSTPAPITVGSTALTWQLLSDQSALNASLSTVLDATQTLFSQADGVFRVMDADGWEVLKTDPNNGVGVGAVWLNMLAAGLLRVRDTEGFELMKLHRSRGLELPTVFLRPCTSALLRIMDVEGFIYFQIDLNGLTKFIGGGSDDDEQDVGDPAVATRMWTGAVTPTGFKVACDIENGSPQTVAQVEVSTDPYFTNVVARTPVVIPAATEKGNEEYWRSIVTPVTGLTAATQYHARIIADGLPSPTLRVKTAPAPGAATAFSIIFGSCNIISADPAVDIASFRAIEQETNVQMIMHLGDIDYSDIEVDDIYLSRSRNTRFFRSNLSAQAVLAKIPAVYMYDDHDSGPNDNNWDTPIPGSSMAAVYRNVRRAYRETVPHYPFVHQMLGETDPDKIIQTQTWDIGKARFVLLDTRTQRRYQSGTPTVLGNGTNPPGSWNQLGWLTGTFLPQAAADAQAGLINRLFVCSPTGWIGAAYDGWQEHWTAEQRAICDAMAANPNLPPMTILTGDFHYCAADDGTNADASTGHVLNSKLTQLMASPFYRRNTLTQGGPFSWLGADGRIPTAEAYCRLDVRANGSWLATFKGAPFDGSGLPTILGTFDSADL